jgi:ABC-type molybdate transport system substrate-binding protein
MNVANIKLPIAVIGLIVAQAFGIIWYVAQLDSTVSNNTTAIESMEVFDATSLLDAIESFDNRLDQIEKQQAIIENEMRTIMSDHSSFNDILKELGKEGYGDSREYGNYNP